MNKIEEAAQQFYFVQGSPRSVLGTSEGIAAAPARNLFTERCQVLFAMRRRYWRKYYRNEHRGAGLD